MLTSIQSNLAGESRTDSNITLDSVDVNDQQNRTAIGPVLRTTLDSIQEFRTTTADANTDQGRTSGAGGHRFDIRHRRRVRSGRQWLVWKRATLVVRTPLHPFTNGTGA